MRALQTSEMAQGRWRSILPTLGVPANALTGKHVPCPICGGKDRFRFDDREGRGTYFCSKCEPHAGDGIDLATAFLGVSKREALQRIDALLDRGNLPVVPTPRVESDEERISAARGIYAEGVPISAGDPVDLYLRSRGLGEMPAGYPATMRFHPGRTAMLMPIQTTDRRVVGVHQTFLTQDGRKADVEVQRRTRGVISDGAVIRFSPAQEVLGIAEGIETAMSASALYGLPVWAAISSGGMDRWVPPAECREVAIFGDNDVSFDGQRAAYALAHRLTKGGLTVTVHLPAGPGDFNDVLRGGRS